MHIALKFKPMQKSILLYIVPVMLVLSSCQKKGCADPNALNYDIEATADDGSCKFQAEDIQGTYSVSGLAVDQTFMDTTVQNYTMIIAHLGGTNVSITNLGNTGYTFNGNVYNNQLSIPTQVKNIVENYQGIGIISGNAISMQYTETFDDVFYNETAVKQ